MIMIRKLVLILAALMVKPFIISAQLTDSLFVVEDSTRVFTLNNLYELILSNHPAAKQAHLLSEMAHQEIRLARGNFDPKLEAQFMKKRAGDVEYFEIFNAAIKAPTLFPLDPSIGLDQNSGPYLNPERYIGENYNYRQFYAGISLPLGKGLVTDERRTALRQAELFRHLTEAEQVKIINKLLLDAAKDYWEWYFSYYNFRLQDRNVRMAEDIFERIKTNYSFGEASVIDTVQAMITRQQRVIERQEALLNFKNAGLRLSNVLWDSLGNPLELNMKWIPVRHSEVMSLTPQHLAYLTEMARTNHPELRKLKIKINQLEADKRLATEYIKPQLNLNYYALNQPVSSNRDAGFLFNDNYKLGIDFSFPILLRKERSKLALTKLKIANTKYEQVMTERQIINDVSAIHNQLENLQTVIKNQQQMMEGYERLLTAEMMNLEQGESDLFKINVQQEKLIQAQTKWIKLLSENEKQKATLYWAAGTSILMSH
jgi:outer membrane protein TolC